MNKTLKTILIILAVIIAIFSIRFIPEEDGDGWVCLDGQWVKQGNPSTSKPVEPCGKENITDFFECIEAGYPVMESYPRKCRAGDQTFIEYIGNELEKTGLIRLDNPRPNQEIKSPLSVTGRARGSWFFEGDFPVVLTDWDGLIIAQGYLTAQSDWMTEDFVEFKGELTFEKPELYNRGSLILQKDNPSGLPQNDDALEIPIFFE